MCCFIVMFLGSRENVALQNFWGKKVQFLGTFNFILCLPRRLKDSRAKETYLWVRDVVGISSTYHGGRPGLQLTHLQNADKPESPKWVHFVESHSDCSSTGQTKAKAFSTRTPREWNKCWHRNQSEACLNFSPGSSGGGLAQFSQAPLLFPLSQAGQESLLHNSVVRMSETVCLQSLAQRLAHNRYKNKIGLLNAPCPYSFLTDWYSWAQLSISWNRMERGKVCEVLKTKCQHSLSINIALQRSWICRALTCNAHCLLSTPGSTDTTGTGHTKTFPNTHMCATQQYRGVNTRWTALVQ